jgi:hypothetical protein
LKKGEKDGLSGGNGEGWKKVGGMGKWRILDIMNDGKGKKSQR